MNDLKDSPREVAREMDAINAKVLEHSRLQEHHAQEASFHARYVLKEARKLTDLRHRLNRLNE